MTPNPVLQQTSASFSGLTAEFLSYAATPMHLIDLIEYVLHRLAGFVRPSYLEVVDEGPNRLELESNRGRFVFDARRRVVSRNGRPLAKFEQIKFIDLTCEKETMEHTEWRVDLYLSMIRRIRIGECRDEALVSAIGAKLVELTGVKPLAWKKSHGITR